MNPLALIPRPIPQPEKKLDPSLFGENEATRSYRKFQPKNACASAFWLTKVNRQRSTRCALPTSSA
jgi:hypothetical protein